MRRSTLASLALATLVGLLAPRASALIWPSAVSSIERDLAADDVVVRRRTAERLSELPRTVLLRVAERALDDADVEVRLLVARAARLGSMPKLGERLIPWLTDSDMRVRVAAAEALASAPAARGVGPLVRALSDSEPTVRRVAAAALGESGAPEAVLGLLGRLDDSALEVQRSVIAALSELGDKRAVVPLISKIEDNRPSVRRAVTRALGALGDKRAQSALVLALRDADASVRVSALSALGALGEAGAVVSIATLLNADPDPAVRRAAVEALSHLSGPEAVQALVDALVNAPEEREVFAMAFERLGTPAAPTLTACLRARVAPEHSEGCALALAATHDPAAGAEIRAALERGSVGLEIGLRALGRAGDAETLSSCLPYLGHADPSVRRAALTAAAQLLDPARGDGRAVEPLEQAFDKSARQRGERIEQIRLLGRTGAPRATRLLSPIAEHADDLDFRLAALTALGDLGPTAAPKTLLVALDDPEPSVRQAAALSIRRAGADVAEQLLDRLERAASQDRRVLALALGGALRGDRSGKASERARRLLDSSRAAERDALIEALGPSEKAGAALAELARSPDPADRAKVAEALAQQRAAVASPLLLALGGDRDGAVRANAIWSLGALGGAESVPLLEGALRDADVEVAANAASALGRVAGRTRRSATARLCDAALDARSAVRASALAALSILSERCPDGRELKLLLKDTAPRVRLSAAGLLRDRGTDPASARALSRCASDDTQGAVAAACASARRARPSGAREVLVFVVPPGQSAPLSRAPFALVRPDGLTRYGVSDRRGAVQDTNIPDGELTLSVPAALDE
ncbi:MAG: HEAT repeat domain-containing protein [Polyangiaceae bacterium]